MEPVIDHIQITVRDFPAAVAFYDRLMPLLGFAPEKRARATISSHDFEVVEYSHPCLAFAITSPRESPEYKPPGYYALFFKDLEGIKYEIVTHSHVQGMQA